MATRTNQKERTHQAIVSAAARLVDSGCANPSIDDIAEEALVSRATVYRYFESTDDVLWQVVSDRHMIDAETARPITSDDLTERVLDAEENVNDYLFGNREGTRAFERVMLDVMFDIPSRNDIETVSINANVVLGKRAPAIRKRANKNAA